MHNQIVTVFGGTGFIGRHLISVLAKRGARIRVPTRNPQRALPLKPMGGVGQIVGERYDLRSDESLAYALRDADMVVNLIGILHGSETAFKTLQAELPGRIGRAASAGGLRRMLQISAIGADANSPSVYARTKAEGEAGAQAAFPDVTVLRPSVVFGPDDAFFNRFAAMSRLSPVLPLIGGGRTRFQPVYVGDVAAAGVAALTRDDAKGQTYELGGPKVYTFKELMQYLLGVVRRDRWLVSLPFEVASVQARFAELLPEPPLTRDQVLLLKSDNVVGKDAYGLRELGVSPTPVEAIVPQYLRRYSRPGPAANVQP